MISWTFPSLRRDGHYLVVGLGATGLAAIRWCLRAGVAVRVLDTRSEPAGLAALRRLPGHESIELHLGGRVALDSLLMHVHTVVVSPGLSPLQPPLKELLKQAQQLGVAIVGETELFAQAWKDLKTQGHDGRLLAVTGTNGKTTVTAMVAHILASTGLQVQAAGNISPATLDALGDALDRNKLPDVWVIELSSFQLYSTHSLVADAVAWLNISQDHLDWHGSWEAYAEAKAGLLDQGSLAIVNRDDDLVMQRAAQAVVSRVVRFGTDAPSKAGDLGLTTGGGMAWLASYSDEMGAQALMPVNALYVQGRHNQLNAMAALQLVMAVGVSMEAGLSALQTYRGEPHRMAFVRNVAGVDFFNDSKGTNVAATVAALQGDEGRVVLIAGGQGKGQDFSPLIAAAREHVKSAVLIGEAASELKRLLDGAGVSCQIANSLEDAVALSFGLAAPGERVVLSPACASHDMFADYGERGTQFVAAVETLALDQGEVA